MDKNYYITTPIYYPSARPHMGHAYSSIIADFFSLGGEKKCFENLESLKLEVDEKSIEEISKNVEETLEKELYKSQDIQYALKLGFWFEKFSPNLDFEKSYIWYSVAVTGGIYKAMKVRDKVRKKIDNETVVKLQKEAKEIYTNIKYFVNKNGEQK